MAAGRMRLLEVDHKELRLPLKPLVHLLEAAELVAKERAGVAAKDQNDRLLAAEARQRDRGPAVGGGKLEVRRQVADFQPAFVAILFRHRFAVPSWPPEPLHRQTRHHRQINHQEQRQHALLCLLRSTHEFSVRNSGRARIAARESQVTMDINQPSCRELRKPPPKKKRIIAEEDLHGSARAEKARDTSPKRKRGRVEMDPGRARLSLACASG